MKTAGCIAIPGLLAVSLLIGAHTASAQGVSVNVGGGVSVGTGGTGGGGSSASDTGGTLGSVLGGALDTLTQENSTSGTSNDQGGALAAVQSDRALPLDKILANARQYTSGDIIDARLITIRGFLLYELKVLDTTGDVRNLYFYAQSGRIVKGQ
jgi:hypothetical protein